MKSSIQKGLMICLGMVALGGLTPKAKAQCGAGMISPKARVQWQNVPSAMAALSVSGARVQPPAAIGTDPTVATIVGLWKITFTSGGQVVDQGFDAWHSDGTETLNDSPAPSTGNVCLGVYSRSAFLGYKLYHPSWTFDDKGNLTGTAIIQEDVTINLKGDTFQGTFTVDVYDLAGNHLDKLSGTVSATRITVN